MGTLGRAPILLSLADSGRRSVDAITSRMIGSPLVSSGRPAPHAARRRASARVAQDLGRA